MKYPYANKDHFVALARDAERQHYNRQVNVDKIIDDMDPEGTNIVVYNMLHEHKAGLRCEPHIRTWWCLKMRGTMEPVEVFLDMSMENWDSLPVLETTIGEKEHEPTV